MSRKAVILAVIAMATGLAAYKVPEPFLFQTPGGWPAPVYDFKAQPLAAAKVTLGRVLFHEPLLSRDNTISCSSCHLPNTAFTHVDHELSHGIEGRIGKRNAPALMNLAWSKSFMWDGAVNHIEVQSLAPIEHPDEMNETLAHVVEKLRASAYYRHLFKTAYGDSLVTGERTLKALAQFMLTLVSANSKYDQVMRGEATFSKGEANGYQVFKAQCASCHTEPLFTNAGFENNGLEVDTSLKDYGRMAISQLIEDSLKFKVPSLRNIEVTYPYMHDGRFRNLQMVLFHYSTGIYQSPSLARQLKGGLALSEEDKRNLIAFLKTLTDEAFLHNPSFQPPPAIVEQ